MPIRPLSSLFAIALACTAGLNGGCIGGSGDTETESGTESATEGESSTGSTSDASTSATSNGTDVTTDDATTDDATSDATTGTTGTTETTGTTTEGVACDLEAIACERAEIGGELFIDCGVVDPWESTSKAWQTARQCALDAIAEEKAFKLVTWLQGIDSEVGYAYVGFEGESYGITRFFYDSYPPAVVNENSCAALTAEASCIGSVDEICLTCVDAGPSATTCGG